MFDHSNTVIITLITAVWLFNSVVIAIVPILAAIGAALALPCFWYSERDLMRNCNKWIKILLFLPYYVIVSSVCLVLLSALAVLVSAVGLLVITPVLTLYCPYMAIRILYHSLKMFK
jgi:hypothetical protein